MNRRDFIKHGARTLLLGGISALVFRHATAPKQQDVCTDKNGYCRKCSALDSCRHPNAISFRQTQSPLSSNASDNL